ncbi:MAG: hypothetical protein AOA65_2266 [Candidatus Bathyarchaeota archaeon BA1]|nr:MAG: hypothetical protein AOA65_2266 [Candidatus Bathyarchaeota archaeon BA1]
MPLSKGSIRLLGYYEGFPENVHGVAQFTHRISIRKLQQIILFILHQLNQDTWTLSDITPFSLSKCEVSFEFGVAEGTVFNYLDEEELDKFEKSIAEKALPILDFFCVVRYHTINKEGKRTPLKFDYHLLRLIFHRNRVEWQISQERGTRRVSLEDLITFIARRVNELLSQMQLKPLTPKHLRTL